MTRNFVNNNIGSMHFMKQIMSPSKCGGVLNRTLTTVATLGVSLLAVQAQTNYSIDWHTIDGGGGTSTGGVYTVSGTIGQPDAGGPMTNGQYSVIGGFWALPQAVQVESAPTLTIAPHIPGKVIISWTPATGTNWVLQETLSLSAANWTNSPSGSTNFTVVPTTFPAKFYRLHQP
jgi:hypothetical protein